MKSINAYLSAAGISGDAVTAATAALQAMQADAQAAITTAQSQEQDARSQVTREIRDNQQARALAGAFRKVAEKAGVDLSALSDSEISTERRRELADTASQQVLDFVGGASDQASDAASILRDAGFDLDAYQKAGKDKRQELARSFTEGVKADRERLQLTERNDALRELGLDVKKASAILGNTQLSKDKVTLTEDGQQVEKEVYGVRSADGTFTPLEAAFQEKGFSFTDLAAQPAQPAVQQEQQPLWVAQPSADTLTNGNLTADAAADQARMTSGNYSPF